MCGSVQTEAPAKTNWPLIMLILAGTVTAATQIGKAPPAVPEIQRELALSLVTAGWVVSISSLIGSCLGIAVGLLADRFGHARLLKYALFAFAVGGALGAAAQGTTFLMISRVIEGGAYLCVAVSVPSLVARLAAPNDRSFALAIYSTCFPLGMAVIILIAPAILAAVGWRGLWLGIAGWSALVFIAVVIFLRDAPPHKDAQPRQPFLRDIRVTITKPGPIILAISFFTYSAQWTAVMVWLPTFIVQQRGTSLAVAAALTSLVIAANVLGNWLGGVLMRRGVPRWLLMISGTLAMGLSAIGFFPETLPDPIRYILCLFFSFCGGVQPASIAAAAPAHAPSPSQLGTTNGYWLQGSQLGILFGAPAVAAVVTATGGWAAAGPALAVGTVVNVGMALWLRRLERN